MSTDNARCTEALGQLQKAHLTYDKLGRPHLLATVDLLWIDDLPQLLLQTQAREIDMTFTTKSELIPLFETP